MYLDILILSHLRAAPVHGYERKRKIVATTAYGLNDNTLYPALRRFEEAGVVSKTAVQQEGRPPRHVYELTDLGHELLHDMVAEFPADLADNEEEFLTRLGMFDELTPSERQAVLASRAQALSARIQHLRILAARAEGSQHNREWGGLVTAELIDRAQRERAWIDGMARLAGEQPCRIDEWAAADHGRQQHRQRRGRRHHPRLARRPGPGAVGGQRLPARAGRRAGRLGVPGPPDSSCSPRPASACCCSPRPHRSGSPRRSCPGAPSRSGSASPRCCSRCSTPPVTGFHEIGLVLTALALAAAALSLKLAPIRQPPSTP